MALPWFSRVWVIQELAVLRHLYLVVNGVEMAWNDLAEPIRFICGLQIPIQTSHEQLQHP
jgi:hypothetical protein